MSTHESNALDTGYFLPEDSQFRLKKLRDYMEFLSRLAQPRTWSEAQDRAPEVPMGDLEICLKLLAEQADLILDEVSWPARLEVVAQQDENEGDAVAAPPPEIPDTADERFAFGVTMDQLDTLDRLIQTISAQGDVLAAGSAAELADHTVPLLGQAIHDGAKAVRDILDRVEAQRLRLAPRPPTGVGEVRAMYGVGFVDSPPGPALPLVAFVPRECVGQPGRLHLH